MWNPFRIKGRTGRLGQLISAICLRGEVARPCGNSWVMGEFGRPWRDLWLVWGAIPNDESLGYYRPSLRDCGPCRESLRRSETRCGLLPTDGAIFSRSREICPLPVVAGEGRSRNPSMCLRCACAERRTFADHGNIRPSIDGLGGFGSKP